MTKVKSFLFSFLIAAFSIMFIAGCSDSSTNLGGGNNSGGGTDNGTDNSTDNGSTTVTPIDLTTNPFSLLGVYNVELYGINEEPINTPNQASELRVGLNLQTAAGGVAAPEVLMLLNYEGQVVPFPTYIIDLSSMQGDLYAFISDTFTGLGAELIEGDQYGLYFKLDPAANSQYQPLIDKGIISEGQYLKLKLTKTQDIQVDAGLDNTEQPTDPEEPAVVPVESIQITTPEKSYYTGSTVTIDFTLNPSNTTDTDVTYETTNNGSGTIKTVDGIGQLVLNNVTQNDTVTFKVNDKQAAFNIVIVNEVESISFLNATEVIEQNQTRTIALENYDVIKDAFSSITYSLADGEKASINSETGEVTGLKNGVVTVTATATKFDGQQLTASYELDVLGHIDYTDETTLQGTYDMVFFGTNSNGSGLANAVIQTNCDTYKSLWVTSSCPSSGLMNGNCQIRENEFAGRAIVKVVNGILKVHTKVAMLYSDMGSLAAGSAKNDRYQYTIYDDRSFSSWQDTGLKGNMIGRNVVEPSNISNATYYFEKDKSYNGQTNLDIILFSNFDGKKAGFDVSPDTRLILRKISSQVIEMDPNTLTEEPFNKINLTLDEKGFIEAPIN